MLSRRSFLRLTTSALAPALIGSSLLKAHKAFADTDRFRDLLEQVTEGYLPQDSRYESLRKPFNKALWAQSFPKLILKPRSTQEVQKIIQWANNHREIPLHLRSGGHSYEGFSTGEGVLVDLSQLNSINIANDKTTVAIGSGLRLGQVVDNLSQHNLMIPTGTCPGVGVTGLVLGGGHGLTTRALGLTSDKLKSIEYVLANGEVVVCSENSHSDLFWASKGAGGGNFGIATNFEFYTTPVEKVTSIQLRYSQTKQYEVLSLFNELAPDLPSSITLGLFINKWSCNLRGVCLESKDQTQAIIDSFIKIGADRLNIIVEESYKDSVIRFGGDLLTPMEPVSFKCKSHYFDQRIPSEYLQRMIQRSYEASGDVGYIIAAHGGVLKDFGPQDSSYCHRQARLNIQYYTKWTNPADKQRKFETIEAAHAELAPFASGSYINYPDLQQQNWQEAYFGSSLQRLRQIKRTYDSQNLFSHTRSIS